MPPLLGCIADDFTGATDLANNLVRGGMRTLLLLGESPAIAKVAYEDADAVVLALKSRSIPADAAVAASLAALDALRSLGARRFMFKYCSTFDSTERGNIGPVAAALMKALNGGHTVFCPTFPQTGRTMCWGHLFVNGRLLHESGMERHPLNPMTDANILRVLQRQSTESVKLLSYDAVCQGTDAIRQRLTDLVRQGARFIVCDALGENHLRDLAKAFVGLELITGGSGIASWLPQAYRESGLLSGRAATVEVPKNAGHTAVLSGSCSITTQRQLDYFQRRYPVFPLNTKAILSEDDVVKAALDWARQQVVKGPFAICSSASPSEVEAFQVEFGPEKAARAVEQTLSAVARGLVELGVGRLIVAGGETAGAVMQALHITALRIGPQIDPGVPWVESLDGPPLALALKSGNFGADDFFHKAIGTLP